MAQILIATIDEEVEEALKRFTAKSPPMICYIDRKGDHPIVKEDKNVFDEDEEFRIEDLGEKLPNAPRYIVLNYKPKGDNFSKVIFINWIPSGCETGASMLHVQTLPVVEKLARFPKVIEVNDGEDGLTPEIIDTKLRR